EAGQQGELLEEHRPLPPRTGLADRQPAERERRGLLECGAPCAEVRGSQQPTVRPRERADRLGDEALVEAGARLLELLLARAALGFRDDPAVRLGELRIAKATARARRRQIQRGRGGPLAEERLDPLDHERHARNDRVTALRVPDGELEDVREAPGAELAQE